MFVRAVPSPLRRRHRASPLMSLLQCASASKTIFRSRISPGLRNARIIPRKGALSSSKAANYSTSHPSRSPRRKGLIVGGSFALFGVAGVSLATSLAPSTTTPQSLPSTAPKNEHVVRHLGLALVRCERIARGVIGAVMDYKSTFGKTYASEEDRLSAYSSCHKRSAERILTVLKENGGETT